MNSGVDLTASGGVDAVLVVQHLQRALDRLGGFVDSVFEILRCTESTLAQGLLELGAWSRQPSVVEREQRRLHRELMLCLVADPLEADAAAGCCTGTGCHGRGVHRRCTWTAA